MQTSQQKKADGVYSREEYAQKDFWNQRYQQNPGFFDWYVQYPQLKAVFEQYDILTTSSILMVGCGNSKLSEQMHDAGFHSLVSMDISEIHAVKVGKDMKFEVGDATAMKYKDQQFDFVIDKGTMDAVICGKNLQISSKLLKQMSRVCREALILITYGSPQGRRLVYEQGLGLEGYEYQFSKINLSDTSMLINLMRSNLKNKPLKQILSDKKALFKSILEYSILQKKIKAAKPQFFVIDWKALASSPKDKQKQQPSQKLSQQPSQKPSQQPSQKPSQQPSQYSQQSPQNKEKEEEEVKEAKEDPEKQQTEKKQVVYMPKKQSHCFVYKIRRIQINQ